MSEPPPRPGRRPPAGSRPSYPGPMTYMGIGMLNAICLLGGGALGWLADTAAGTLPLFMLLGLLGGAGLGIAGTRAELRRHG